MISIVRLWETIMQMAKTGTSGYQSEEEFNRDVEAVQTQLMSLLSPSYADNVSVREILSPFVLTATGNTNASGLFAKPADYFQALSASVSGYPAWEIGENEEVTLRYLPTRRPSVSSNIYCYIVSGDSVTFLPKQVLAINLIYLRLPENAEVTLTPVSSEDSDYNVATSGGDLEWPERAFNLILYLMLQRLGVEMKENLLIEFSQLGLQLESSATT